MPAAAELPARARPDPGRTDADRDVVRGPLAGRRVTGARRGSSDLPHAGQRWRQPRLRARHVPCREPLGHARVRHGHEELGEHPLLGLDDGLRRDRVPARQRLHVRQVPDVASQHPRLRRPAPALRPERLHDRQLGLRALARHDRGQRAPPALPQQHHRGHAHPPRRRHPGHDRLHRAVAQPRGRRRQLVRAGQPRRHGLPVPVSTGAHRRVVDYPDADEPEHDRESRRRLVDDRRASRGRGRELFDLALRHGLCRRDGPGHDRAVDGSHRRPHDRRPHRRPLVGDQTAMA